MTPVLSFAVVGTGGVGGYFGTMLHEGGAAVRFLARGSHLEAMQRQGLRLESGGRFYHVPPDRIVGSPAATSPVDVVLFSVKSYDTESTARTLGPLLHDGTIVISLQNGVENEEILTRLLPRGTVFGGVAYIYATITAPGSITEWGGPKRIVFGPLSPAPELLARGDAILSAVRAAGLDAECTGEIRIALWRKFLFITAVGGITALSRLTLGEILASPETRTLLRQAMEETAAVAAAANVGLEPGYVDEVFERLKKYDNNSRSSLYNDLVHHRRLELDALSGTVRRIGLQHGIATPVHDTIYAALIPYHRRAVAALQHS